MTYDKKNAVAFAKKETAKGPVYDAEFHDYHDAKRDDGAGVIMCGAGLIAILCAALFVAAMVLLLPEMGPNCPGMDPSHIGWCEVGQ